MIDAGIMQAYKGYTEPFIQTNGINSNVAGTPYLTSYYWANRSLFFKAQFEIINDLFVFAEYWNTNIDGLSMTQYTAPFYYNKTNTITVGLNAGF
jgi:hypothetical protein